MTGLHFAPIQIICLPV